MGQLLNSPWVEQFHRRSDVRLENWSPLAANTARVIAGAARGARHGEKKPPQPVREGADPHLTPPPAVHASRRNSFPLQNISPGRVGLVLPDLLLISAAFLGVWVISAHQLPAPVLVFYLMAYALVAAQGVSYGHPAQAPRSLLALIAATVVAGFFSYLALAISPQPTAVRSLAAWIGLSLLLVLARHHAARSQREAFRTRHVMIVGNPSFGQAVFESIRRDGRMRDVREFLLDRCLLDLHGAELMSQIARQACIDEVIIATADPAIMRAAVREARRNRLDISVVPDLSGVHTLACEYVGGVPLLKVSEQRSPEWELAGKRVLDVMLSAIGLVAILPVFGLIAILVLIESRGPVLYRSVRVGQKGRRFNCCKFRTMIAGAEATKSTLRAQNQRNGAFFKIADDPRVTRVGRFLRRYSLDELPQLWNVLRGDMSLVGPRPHPPDDVARYGTEDLRRLDFVPGITGLWQVTARQDPSFQRCVDLDVEYIESWSLWLDFRILWRTIGVVLQGTGA